MLDEDEDADEGPGIITVLPRATVNPYRKGRAVQEPVEGTTSRKVNMDVGTCDSTAGGLELGRCRAGAATDRSMSPPTKSLKP